jgi:hypothetical protein
MIVKKKQLLKGNLFEAINKVLQVNNARKTNKIEKVIQRSIRRIVKKIDWQIEK